MTQYINGTNITANSTLHFLAIIFFFVLFFLPSFLWFRNKACDSRLFPLNAPSCGYFKHLVPYFQKCDIEISSSYFWVSGSITTIKISIFFIPNINSITEYAYFKPLLFLLKVINLLRGLLFLSCSRWIVAVVQNPHILDAGMHMSCNILCQTICSFLRKFPAK